MTSKVVELERGSSRGGDDDEYDRPNSSDLLQPNHYDNEEEEDYYYGDSSLRRGYKKSQRDPATNHYSKRGRNREPQQQERRGRSLTRSIGGIRDRSRSYSRNTRSISNSSINRLHGGGKMSKRKKRRDLSHDGSLNSYGRRSKSNNSNRRLRGDGLDVLGIQKRKSKSGPNLSSRTKMSASERRKQYNMQQRYPTKRNVAAARGGGVGAIKLLRRGRSTSREPVPRRRGRSRAWG